jgi:hypothetical protein
MLQARPAKPSLQRSKEQVIIAEVLLDKMAPNLEEDDKKELVSLIKEAGTSKELKAYLKDWDLLPTGGSSSFLVWVQIPLCFEGADSKDH